MKEGKASTKTYLVEVTPITSAPTQGALSYFSTTRLSPGTLVKIPVRKKLMLGVVLRSRDVKSAKSDIRRAGFILKKIPQRDILEANLPAEIMETLAETGRYYAVSTGTLLNALLPKAILTEPAVFLKPVESKKKQPAEHSRETILMQMETDERFGQYRALVRQCFARGASVMFVVPSQLEIPRAQELLSKGISEFVHVFALSSKKDVVKNRWLSARNEKHPILFITTPAGLFFRRPDLDTIIVERENSRAYRLLSRPFLHLKFFIELFAKKTDKQLVLGDSVLSLETLWREKSGYYGESSLIRWRLPAAPALLIDTKTTKSENGHFEILSPELKDLISQALSEKEKIFLFGARKGLAPTTVCGDCGYVLPCLNCGAGVVLHRRGEQTIYVCHACGSRRESTTTCGNCGSWKLVPLGIGTEQIAKAAKELFPHHHIQILDKDYASTDRQAKLVVKQFQEKGEILVGTELAFYHLESVAYTGLVSADALFSIPDFGINERIFYLVSRLREMTQKRSIIQTRNIGKQILAWASQGNIIDFYQNEIKEREQLLYPPFSLFIKITLPARLHSHEQIRLKEQFRRWHPDVLKDSLVMRIAKSAWPDSELIHELSLLGPEFGIKVDPESIL